MNRRDYSTLTDSEKQVFEQACSAVCRHCNDNFFGNTTKYGSAEMRIRGQWVHRAIVRIEGPDLVEICDALAIRARFAQELAPNG